MKAIAFATRRARLDPLEAGDEALYCRLYTDPDVMAFIGAPLSPAVARRDFRAACRLNAARSPREVRWAVRDAATGRGLGLLALVRGPPGTLDAELGFMLLPEAQGRGLARELVDGAATHAFADCDEGPASLWARHAPSHGAVAAILAASGFRPGPALDGSATWVLGRGQWRARDA